MLNSEDNPPSQPGSAVVFTTEAAHVFSEPAALVRCEWRA